MVGVVITDLPAQHPDARPLVVVLGLTRATVGGAEAQEWLEVARREQLPCRIALEEPLELPEGYLEGLADVQVTETFTEADKILHVMKLHQDWSPYG